MSERSRSASDQKALAVSGVASRIREARKLAGLSQGQVARLLGLHRPSVSEIEAGNRRVTTDEISRLAELFDVSVSWLIGESAEVLDAEDPRVQLAARELKKLKPDELDRLLRLLAKLRDANRGIIGTQKRERKR